MLIINKTFFNLSLRQTNLYINQLMYIVFYLYYYNSRYLKWNMKNIYTETKKWISPNFKKEIIPHFLLEIIMCWNPLEIYWKLSLHYYYYYYCWLSTTVFKYTTITICLWISISVIHCIFISKPILFRWGCMSQNCHMKSI